MKFQALILVFATLLGCSSPPDSAISGTGGTTTTAIETTTETASGGGGAGGATTTSSTTTPTETSCVPGVEACMETPSYPDPLLAYDPAQNVVDAVGPFLPYESPTGAATGLLGPWSTDKTITAVTFVVEQVPSTITVSVQLEAACGVPPQDHNPNEGAVTIDGSLITSEPFDALGAMRITVPLPDAVTVPAGKALYVSRILTESSAHVDAITPAGKIALRSYWWGVVDNNCDGKKDKPLGWASLAHPTAPGIAPYNHDLGIGVVTD